MRRALSVVAVTLGQVVAGFAVHLEAVFRTVLWLSGAVLRQVTVIGWLPAHTSSGFELWVKEHFTSEEQRLEVWVCLIYTADLDLWSVLSLARVFMWYSSCPWRCHLKTDVNHPLFPALKGKSRWLRLLAEAGCMYCWPLSILWSFLWQHSSRNGNAINFSMNSRMEDELN